jgi:hypothetical protein
MTSTLIMSDLQIIGGGGGGVINRWDFWGRLL